MVIIYYCFGGAHSSVLAAAIHTHMLSADRIPKKDEIINLPHYDKTPSQMIGIPFCFGKDEFGNRVYILGTGKAKKIVINALKSFMEIEEINQDEVYLENTLKNVNLLVRIGGFLSRGLGLIFPGRILTVYGLQRAYPKFVQMVKRVKEEIAVA